VEQFDQISGFLSSIEQAGDVEALFAAVEKAAARLGFERFTYDLGARGEGGRTLFFSTNYPSQWVERYIAEHYAADDVVLHRMAQTARPFSWREVVTNPRMTKAQRQVLDEGREFGLVSGAAVFLSGPGPTWARFVVSTAVRSDEFEKMFARSRHLLNLMAIYTHERAIELIDKPGVEARIVLTPREIEVLKWTARGKTGWEIAQILSISEPTVKEHVRNVCRKFGVKTKIHAASLAIWNGYVTI
jgi:DNA-binding CsgD family transcriptional regulator